MPEDHRTTQEIITPSTARWTNEADAFIRQFADRTATWGEHPGDLEDVTAAPWCDLDHPDPMLDGAYRSGIAPREQRTTAEADGWDSITVLRARGCRLAKLIARDGAITDYDAAKHFDMIEVPVAGLDHLEEDLRRLLHQPDRCVVRGKVADIGRSAGMRRLLYPDGDDPASLTDVPRRWLALDVDGLARPANIAVANLVACAGIAIVALPSEFHDARCLAQATAGHGYKPGLRLRLWFWLDRPVSGAELKRWLSPTLVDHSLFSAAQIIYTAAPVFDGLCDPLTERLVRLPAGAACVAVPDIPEPEHRSEPAPVRPATGLSRYAEAALDNACRRIVAAEKEGRDRAVTSEAYGIGRLAGAGAIPPAFALRVLHHAVAQIPGYSPRRDSSKVERSFGNGMRNPRETLHD